jgi:hypothetical protein
MKQQQQLRHMECNLPMHLPGNNLQQVVADLPTKLPPP